MASLILLNRLEAIGFAKDHQELALQARAELENTLLSRGFEAPTSEQPVEPAPEQAYWKARKTVA
ncbi:hypothetical protein [Marinobacter piscensis]|uniref:hypothetical protein n=1 Tax=Marinobacter piscensis TaxID=1562308 RepID=UPI0011A0904C|nr:hypothetical protein [Marinobacter piscensis]